MWGQITLQVKPQAVAVAIAGIEIAVRSEIVDVTICLMMVVGYICFER